MPEYVKKRKRTQEKTTVETKERFELVPFKLRRKRVKFFEPLNKTFFYKIAKASTLTLLTLNVLDLPYEEFDKLYVCKKCYVSPVMTCADCIKFYKYNQTFLIETLFGFYKAPPPTFFSDRNFNFLKTFLKNTQTFLKEKDITSIKNFTPPTDEETIEEFLKFKETEEKKFEMFLTHPFNNGVLKQQFSGKKSTVRNLMLGKVMPSMRYVLTIDTQLGPDEVSIPKIVYDKLNLKSNFVIVNRAPSINDTCIYTAVLRWHEDSFTAKISALIADGLHADQDGDEITIFMLPETNVLPNYDEVLMMKEIRNNLWSIGLRHKFDYSPKISFGQYYMLVMYIFHDKICELLPTYKNLPCAKEDKPEFIMNMFCGSHYHLGVKFISDLLEIIKDLALSAPSIVNILRGNLGDIVNSKSKGTKNHLSEFLRMMKGLREEEYFEEAMKAFNKYIISSCQMSKSGQQLYSMLFGTSSVTIIYNTLTYMNRKICENFFNKRATECVQYNKYDILYLKHLLIQDAEARIKQEKESVKLQIKKPTGVQKSVDIFKVNIDDEAKTKTVCEEVKIRPLSVIKEIHVVKTTASIAYVDDD